MRCGQGILGSLELFELRPRLLCATLWLMQGELKRDAPETWTADVEALVRAKREAYSIYVHILEVDDDKARRIKESQ